MNYSSATSYFSDLGFTFEYDNSKSICFSDCHVLWKGEEFGIMYIDHMSLRDGEGMTMDFHYDYIDQPTQELLNTLDRFWSSVDLDYRTQKEKDRRIKAVKEYFEERR